MVISLKRFVITALFSLIVAFIEPVFLFFSMYRIVNETLLTASSVEEYFFLLLGLIFMTLFTFLIQFSVFLTVYCFRGLND